MFENLSKEVLEKVKQAKSKEEALELLKQNGITLSDEDLAGAVGGDGIPPCDPYTCWPLSGQCPMNCAITCPLDDTCPKDYCSYRLGP